VQNAVKPKTSKVSLARWRPLIMREQIKKRLSEDRIDTLDSIAIAENATKSEAVKHGALHGSRVGLQLNEDNKAGLARYIDGAAKFIHHVAGSSHLQYAEDLREAANLLKKDMLIRIDRQLMMTRAFPGNSERADIRARLGPALDKIIERKLEDFAFGIIGDNKMEPKDTSITHNTVNIVNSNISHTVLTITQSGKDAISKDVAQKLEQMLGSEEIRNLPVETQLDVLDQAEAVVGELNQAMPDAGKISRGLKRLGKFLTSTGTEIAAKFTAELTVAYMRAKGLV
jgi:hypothetical protein